MFGRDNRAEPSGNEKILGSQCNANGGEHLRDCVTSFGDRRGRAIILERPDRPQTRCEQHIGRLADETSLCDRFLHDVDRAQQRVDHGRRWQHRVMLQSIGAIGSG